MASIRYVAIGRTSPRVRIAYSRNGGKSWQENVLVAGQTFHIPSNCTHLLIDNVPYSPGINIEIREGKVCHL